MFLSAYGITISFQRKETKNPDCSLKELCLDDFCRYIKLLSGFWVIYILAQIFSFLGRSNTEIYGVGTKRILFTLIDALGLASVFGTPTFNSTWWYMGLATTILLIMPFLYKAYSKVGITIVFLAVILPRMFSLEFSSLHWYLPSMCLGVVFAKENLFVRLHRVHRWKYDGIGKFVLAAILLFLCAWIRHKTGMLLDITDAALAVLVIYIGFELFAERGTRVKMIAGFCGKYSMNMFLAHTFFKAYYFHDFIYSFGNAWLILFVLVITTVLFSVCVELGKEYSGYNRFIMKQIERVRKVNSSNP